MNYDAHRVSLEEKLEGARVSVGQARLAGWVEGMEQAARVVRGRGMHLVADEILKEADNVNDYDGPQPSFPTQRKPKKILRGPESGAIGRGR